MLRGYRSRCHMFYRFTGLNTILDSLDWLAGTFGLDFMRSFFSPGTVIYYELPSFTNSFS